MKGCWLVSVLPSKTATKLPFGFSYALDFLLWNRVILEINDPR